MFSHYQHEKNRIVPQLISREFCHLICKDKSHIYAYHRLILPVPSWKHLSCHFSLLILLAQEFQICLLLSHIFSLHSRLHRSTRYKWKFYHFRYLFRTVTFPVEVKRRNLKNRCAALFLTGQFTVMATVKVAHKTHFVYFSFSKCYFTDNLPLCWSYEI